MGRCDSLCDSTHLNLTRPPAPDPDDGCEAEGRRVFVTPEPVLPSFGGAAKADEICQKVADDAHLGGTFLAWVSEAGSEVAMRFTHPAVPYRLQSGTVIANGWTALVSPPIAHPIDEDPNGMVVPSTETWTGTLENGLYSGVDCAGWSSVSINTLGSVGLTSNVQTGPDIGWSEVYLQNCDRTNVHLYCFQQ